ncbi:MAG TPA: 2-phospho-L-lactate guanylyltransferase [Dermatophilaceae bacterium]|nr:2-phospho-L-lactate guanylyltransferase [Dermatophilaceae bacterium]
MSERWTIVVPVKGDGPPNAGAPAKSRLEPPPGVDRQELALALAADTVAAALGAIGTTGRVVVVTGGERARRLVAECGAVVVADPGGGLNAAVAQGLEVAGHDGQEGPAGVLLGDLPSLRDADLRTALRACAAYSRALVPDHHGTGTVLLTAQQPAALHPAFGAGSAARHEQAGHVRLELDLARLRTDVDDGESLRAALRLGIGPATRAALGGAAPRVATVESLATDGSGTVRLEDGRRCRYAASATDGSGLRRLRPGQRVSVLLPAGESAEVTDVWLPTL